MRIAGHRARKHVGEWLGIEVNVERSQRRDGTRVGGASDSLAPAGALVIGGLNQTLARLATVARRVAAGKT